MEAIIEKLIFMMVKAYLKARLDPEIIKLSQDSVITAATTNKDDENFIRNTIDSGWSDTDILPDSKNITNKNSVSRK